MLALLNVILGGALLVAGRKLFWLLVGTIGFLVGVAVAVRLFRASEILVVVAGLAFGLMFALLAIFVESVAIGLAGFLGGGYVGLSIAGLLGLNSSGMNLGAFIVGGIIGVILIVALFEWALITISSLAGASMVVSGLGLGAGLAGPAYLALLLAGVLYQGFVFRRETAPARPNAK